jgi:hypothetical protein
MSQSPFSLLDITTTDSGLICRWDSHPLERQLASLHQIRTSGITAYGSHLGGLASDAATRTPLNPWDTPSPHCVGLVLDGTTNTQWKRW